MKHLSAIIIKFLIITVILEILLKWMTILSFGGILVISAVVTIASYLIGDLLILAKSNNIVASITDAVLSLLIIFLFNYWPGFYPIRFSTALICGIVIGVGEWFYHKYIVTNVLPETKHA